MPTLGEFVRHARGHGSTRRDIRIPELNARIAYLRRKHAGESTVIELPSLRDDDRLTRTVVESLCDRASIFHWRISDSETRPNAEGVGSARADARLTTHARRGRRARRYPRRGAARSRGRDLPGRRRAGAGALAPWPRAALGAGQRRRGGDRRR